MDTGTTPEDAGDFIGTDPADEVVVNVGNARFKIGPMPAFVWEKLSARHNVAHQNATRKAIKTFAEQGRDTEELAFPNEKSDVTQLAIAAMGDPEFQEEAKRVQLEAARWSVRGHERFVRRDGSPFPMDTEGTTVDGQTYTLVGPTLLSVLRVNSRVLRTLWLGIRALNDLGVGAKKA